MKTKAAFLLSGVVLNIGLLTVLSTPAMAQLTGPADVSRIKPEEKLPPVPSASQGPMTLPTVAPSTQAPEGADKIRFVLRDVKIEGVTAFTQDELRDIYAASIGQDISLDTVYKMAGLITERYRNAGYFLSLAYVPDQSIKDGTITIKVVEGYVGRVEIDQQAGSHATIQKYIDKLQSRKPLTSKEIESFLLRLNDLPGYSFSGVLSPLDGGAEGAVKLVLVHQVKEGRGSITFDNLSSRFLGPHETSASYTASLVPLQQTAINGLISLPADELKYITLAHSVAVAPDFVFDVSGSLTKAKPGYTLKPLGFESDSVFLSAGLTYQWIRQRQENLSLKVSIDGRNSSTDLPATPFTRDHVRALRANASYDRADSWRGYNLASLTISQGIDGLGSSSKGDLNLSRAQAEPNFTKAELSLTRLQGVTDDWSVLISAAAQKASGPLFSSEEFGYGGQSFGRAYDSSEITGDHGLAGSFELRYTGFSAFQPVSLVPYAFYDMGVVWNDDVAQAKRESGSSTGIGLRAETETGLSGNIGLAWPLTREIATPLYGEGSKAPRVSFRVSQGF